MVCPWWISTPPSLSTTSEACSGTRCIRTTSETKSSLRRSAIAWQRFEVTPSNVVGMAGRISALASAGAPEEVPYGIPVDRVVVLRESTEEGVASAVHRSFACPGSRHDRDREFEHRSLHLCDLVIESSSD